MPPRRAGSGGGRCRRLGLGVLFCAALTSPPAGAPAAWAAPPAGETDKVWKGLLQEEKRETPPARAPAPGRPTPPPGGAIAKGALVAVVLVAAAGLAAIAVLLARTVRRASQQLARKKPADDDVDEVERLWRLHWRGKKH